MVHVEPIPSPSQKMVILLNGHVYRVLLINGNNNLIVPLFLLTLISQLTKQQRVVAFIYNLELYGNLFDIHWKC